MDEDKIWNKNETRERMYPDYIKEARAAYAATGNPALGQLLGKKQGEYTVEDYYALPEDCRVELIDGVIYNMAAPSTLHQVIAGEIYYWLKDYIRKNHGRCLTVLSPADVQLDEDNRTMVQPDVFVYCIRKEMVEEEEDISRAFQGAPDLVIEVLSPSSRKRDRVIKYYKYKNAGVREYWIVDPVEKCVTVHLFEAGEETTVYTYEDEIPVHIYDGKCRIPLNEIEESEELLRELRRW